MRSLTATYVAADGAERKAPRLSAAPAVKGWSHTEWLLDPDTREYVLVGVSRRRDATPGQLLEVLRLGRGQKLHVTDEGEPVAVPTGSPQNTH